MGSRDDLLSPRMSARDRSTSDVLVAIVPCNLGLAEGSKVWEHAHDVRSSHTLPTVPVIFRKGSAMGIVAVLLVSAAGE